MTELFDMDKTLGNANLLEMYFKLSMTQPGWIAQSNEYTCTRRLLHLLIHMDVDRSIRRMGCCYTPRSSSYSIQLTSTIFSCDRYHTRVGSDALPE